jgi:hypothetical protein
MVRGCAGALVRWCVRPIVNRSIVNQAITND